MSEISSVVPEIWQKSDENGEKLIGHTYKSVIMIDREKVLMGNIIKNFMAKIIVFGRGW